MEYQLTKPSIGVLQMHYNNTKPQINVIFGRFNAKEPHNCLLKKTFLQLYITFVQAYEFYDKSLYSAGTRVRPHCNNYNKPHIHIF